MTLPSDPIKVEEWRRKQRESHIGKKASPETRAKMSAAHKGKKMSSEAIEKTSAAHRGRKRSRETCLKISNANKNPSPETRAKMSAAHKGKPILPEHRAKLSAALKGRESPNKGKKASPETRAKMVAMRKGEKSHFWKGGISFEPYCPDFNPSFKERVRKFFGRVCVECGKTESENGRRLDTHHVNYDKMVCCNGVKPLLVALCKSCHCKVKKTPDYWEQHFTELIDEKYGGCCYLPKEMVKNGRKRVRV